MTNKELEPEKSPVDKETKQPPLEESIKKDWGPHAETDGNIVKHPDYTPSGFPVSG